MSVLNLLMDGVQTVLLGYAAGCIVALAGLVRASWKGEEF